MRGPSSIGRPRLRRSASCCAAASDLNRLAKPSVFQRSRDLPSWPASYHRQMTTFFPFLRLTTLGNPVLVCLFLTSYRPFRKRRTTNEVYPSLHPLVQFAEFEAPGLSSAVPPRVGRDFLKASPFIQSLHCDGQIGRCSLHVDVRF